jgi:hypothetical protein
MQWAEYPGQREAGERSDFRKALRWNYSTETRKWYIMPQIYEIYLTELK